MGSPKRQRKKYKTPMHPWSAPRIAVEKELIKEYGLRNKKELWKMGSMIKRFRDQGKRLIADTTDQGIKEKNQLLTKLSKLNLVQSDAIEDVLNLTINDILERRLQTFVYKKNLSNTINQARQFIVHGHIGIEGKKVNVPSYLVLKDEESLIGFLPKSDLSSEEHPERAKRDEKKIKKEEKKEKNRDKLKDDRKKKGKNYKK